MMDTGYIEQGARVAGVAGEAWRQRRHDGLCSILLAQVCSGLFTPG
jgi:hypothetical protein